MARRRVLSLRADIHRPGLKSGLDLLAGESQRGLQQKRHDTGHVRRGAGAFEPDPGGHARGVRGGGGKKGGEHKRDGNGLW